MWICILSGRQSEDSFENPQRRKVKQIATSVTLHPLMQVIWVDIKKPTVEKVKQIKPVRLGTLSGRWFEDSYVYDVLWCFSSMMFYYILWCSMVFCDVLVVWGSKMFYDVLWLSMMFYDVLWCSMMFFDVLWCSLMFYDVLWCSMFHSSNENCSPELGSRTVVVVFSFL